jgi:hypothetical protein
MKRSLFSLLVLTAVFTTLLIFQNMTNSNQIFVADAVDVSAEEQAMDLYRRLGGVTVDLNDATYKQMVDLIKGGNRRAAAALVVNQKDFYQVTVRDFAGKMSTREGTALAPLSDFVATVIGVVRDDIPAPELLTGNFYYRSKKISTTPTQVMNDIVKSNNHYATLEASGVSLMDELEGEDGQKVLSADGNSVVVLDDSGGLLTSRAFLAAHANAGTNRRIIEYTFKIFQCAPIDTWASTSNPDDHVGREVGRFPISEYNNKCKGCHTGMDGMRPATAYFDFAMTDATTGAGYIKYKNTYPKDPNDTDMALTVPVPADEQNVPYKFRRASTVFPLGYAVKNNQWVNYANSSFGWNTPKQGQGMSELAQMIAYSDGFKRCMVKRVFNSVCKSDLTSTDSGLINKLTDSFTNSGYKLKELFIDVALRPECLGVGI